MYEHNHYLNFSFARKVRGNFQKYLNDHKRNKQGNVQREKLFEF